MHHFFKIKRHFIFLVLALTLLYLSACTAPTSATSSDEVEILDVPITIYRITSLNMIHESGVTMSTWINESDLINTVLPEINAIWEQAHIRFHITQITDVDVIQTESLQTDISTIVSATRQDVGHDRETALNDIVDQSWVYDGNTIDVYVLPFVGNTYQGLTYPDITHIQLGCFSNKNTPTNAPEKVYLVEDWNAFERGSFARTFSHEIGHALSLTHDGCTTECLMGGSSAGYMLTEEQIENARVVAKTF